MRKLSMILFFLLFANGAHPQGDTVIKVPKHYFNTIVLWDYYQKPKIDFTTADYVSNKLKSYQIKQNTIAFNIPVFTKDIIKRDSLMANMSFLFTGYFLSYNPNFSGLPEKHILTKNGIGVRFVYNTGRKSIFFADFSPFSTIDRGYQETRITRLASLFLWSYTFSSQFNLRLGLTKSFMWGNRYYLPYIGFRIGALNKVNFSLQFPRVMSLNIPIHSKFQVSLFTKPQGGVFTISNKDTIYAAFLNQNKLVYLGRYEFLGGLRVDVKPVKFLSLYVSLGSSINNYLGLYSLSFNRSRNFIYRSFFVHQWEKSTFVNFGIVGYFGKTKSYYQMDKIDEMIHLNNEMGVGDNNLQVFQVTDNMRKEKFKVSNNEVADLINSFDY